MNKQFGLIVNANAGKVKSAVYKKQEFQTIFGDAGDIIETLSLNEMKQAVKEFQTKQIEILFIYGGDGTHQKVITEIIEQQFKFPFIVPLKGGTMNMLVKDLGLGGCAKTVAKNIVTGYRDLGTQLPTQQKPILKFSYDQHTTVYGFYFANGVIYRLLEQYYKNHSSVLNAFKVSLKGLLGSILSNHSYSKFFEPMQCKLTADSTPLQTENYIAMMISTLNRVVFGMTPFISKPKSNHQFSFVGYHFSKKQLLQYFFLLAKGMDVGRSKMSALTAKSMTIQTDNGFLIDGEMYEINKLTEISIEIGDVLTIPLIY